MYARRTRIDVDPDLEAPEVTWPDLYSYLTEHFQQGDHVAIIGPTGTGKTHIALEIAELRSYVMVVACKPKDPLIDDARAKGYYLLPGRKMEVPYVDGRPLHKRVIYWPRLSDVENEKLRNKPQHLMQAEKAMQKPAVGSAIGYVRRNGSWCLVIDEGTWVCRDLGLQKDIDSSLNMFRTINASLIVLGQRPAWMGQYVLSQPTHLFLFKTANGDDLKKLGDISGANVHAVRELVAGLDKASHQFLYIDTRHDVMFRSVGPPR